MRSAHWNNAIPHIKEWVLHRFEAAGKSPWDYVEGRVSLAQVGINAPNFRKELAPKILATKRDEWTDAMWWNRVNSRIFYLFHRAGDKGDRANGKSRPRCWAEWHGPVPPRP